MKQRIHSLLANTIQVKPCELSALLTAFVYFFVLLCSYYIIRPMRDEMGVQGGVENLQWLFTGTLLVMTAAIPLFGWVSSHFPRRRFLPYVYGFFIASLLLFYLLMDPLDSNIAVARAFFIWSSVFNLFVVSVFWSFMTDLFNNEQARRLFGFIAAGGTAGALAGPALTALLVQSIGAQQLLLLSALLLSVAILCIHHLGHWTNPASPDMADDRHNNEQPIEGGIWDGVRLILRSPYLLGIGLLMLLFTTLATFLYFMQAQIIRDAFSDPAQRTAVFALIDLAVNGLTLAFQLFLTSRLIQWLGLAAVLALVPLLLAAGFALIAAAPVLPLLLAVQVIRRAGNYAIMRPAREMLYVVLRREEKYKAKNILDTLVYRGGDAVSAWIYTGLRSLGIGLSGIAWIAVPLSLIWALVAYRLGRQQNQRAEHASQLTGETEHEKFSHT